jgi:glycogen debranching enzyme
MHIASRIVDAAKLERTVMMCLIVRKRRDAGKKTQRQSLAMVVRGARRTWAGALVSFCLSASAQPALHAVAEFPLRQDGPVLRRPVETGEPFTVAGPQGVAVGQQQGPFEAWVLPVKLLSHMTLQADVEGYPVPLDLNGMAREMEVRPDRTTIVYSHIAVTVRQTMFAPDDAPSGSGVVVLFEIDSVRPVTLTLRFTPEMREMWPKPGSGTPSAEWVARGTSGFYLLHTDVAELTGAIALPRATSGIMAPYQERPQSHPLELILHVDPARDRHMVFPLLMAVGTTKETANPAALEATLVGLNDRLAAMYAAHAARWAERERELTSIVTPDAALNADLQWAETSITQLRARTRPSAAFPSGEMGLVAGYYASGDSARPGFGWYFGRDTLYTLYAIDSYGDFALARTALEFLMRRQRADGKAMHEYSQTAGDIDWASLPYEYAAADATPLFLTAMLDYLRASGDVAFLREHRDSIDRAWRFETTHDSDGDGIYDNAQGTGWVESWPGGMPKQEVYLALLDEQGSAAMAELAKLLGEDAVADAAAKRMGSLHATIEREYYRPQSGTYAFSRNVGGVLDTASTVFPSVAWWNGGGGLDHPEASLQRWASHEFASDWGLRDVAENDPVYDPISYHQGSVWPLFTGWAALAEYRAGHPLAGYAALMQNAALTEAQDPGAVTELLSGAFYEPFGRSTSHQLWSSAMVVTPLLRGLFGIEVDALHHVLTVKPHLPADWPSAEVHRLHVGESVVDLTCRRDGVAMVVSVATRSGPTVHLAGGKDSMQWALPAIEVVAPHGLPERGARTAQPKVVAETSAANSLQLEIEGLAGTSTTLRLIRNNPAVQPYAEGGELEGDALRIRFSEGSGWVTQKVTVRW